MKLSIKYRELDKILESELKELADKIRPFLSQFLEKTNLPITGIYPDCVEITEMGDPEPNYLLGDIRISVKKE